MGSITLAQREPGHISIHFKRRFDKRLASVRREMFELNVDHQRTGDSEAYRVAIECLVEFNFLSEKKRFLLRLNFIALENIRLKSPRILNLSKFMNFVNLLQRY